MPNDTTCLKCGVLLATDARQGFCPKCLFAQAASEHFEDSANQLDSSDPATTAESSSTPSAAGSIATGRQLPLTFGDYQLLEEIARGGMGIVYRARNLSLDRIVAVKMLLLGPLASVEFVKRFRAEASAAASLLHPNIVAIHEVGVHQGQQYFAMDYVEGQSMAKLLADGPLPARRAAIYLKTIAEAIHYAHEHGILHRDLKPSNVLIDSSDQPRVTDFGLARRLEGDSELTVTGQVLGSPNYMPPEQAVGRRGKVSRRSDVYSLGAMLYHLLTGRPPFVGEALTDTLEQVLNVEPVSPRLLNPSVPRDLETICLKCLEKDANKRYATAQVLADELGRFLNNEPVHARPVTRVERAWRWCRRKPALAGLLVALHLVFALGLAGVLWQWRRATVSESVTRQNLYAADMNVAQQAFENGNLGRTRDLLKAHWPRSGQPDSRGFEWHYLWNLCQGDNFQSLRGHSNVVLCIAFSPDGKTLVSGSGDWSVKLWDVASRRLVATLPAHSNRVISLAFSTDGQTLGTVGDDGLIKLWNITTAQLLFTLNEKAGGIAFSPTQTLLAIGQGLAVYGEHYGGRKMKLWDYVTHQVVKTFQEQGSQPAFSPDGQILAAQTDKDIVKLWNVETGKEVRKLENAGEVRCLKFSPDGQTVVAGNWAGEVQRWNVATGARMLALEGHTTTVWSLAFSPDRKTLATGSSDQTVRLWNVTTGKEESKLFGHGSEVRAVAFAPDGQTLATGGKDEMVMLWSTVPKRAQVVMTNVDQPPSFSPDDKLLATSKFHGPVTVWDVATRQPVWVLNSEEFVQFPDEGGTLATISTNGILRFWDVATQTLQRAVELPGITDSTQQFRFALRGKRLAAARDDDIVTLHDATTGGVIGKFKPYAGYTGALAFSPDAGLLATASRYFLPVKLWSVATQKELAVVPGHKNVVSGLAFSPDGSLLATASWDDTVGLFRIATAKAEAPLTGIKEGCTGVAFAPEGKTLAVAGEDGTVRLWNLATKREVAVLRHGKAALRFVVFSPDGQILVSVCENGTMRFWDAPNSDAPHPRINE